jgi:hypothetical protein
LNAVLDAFPATITDIVQRLHLRDSILAEFGQLPATGLHFEGAADFRLMIVREAPGGEWLVPFPTLQIVEGRPSPAMAVATGWLCESVRGWMKPFWWTTPNPWLEGRRPIDVYLTGDSPRVAQVARRQAHLR